MTKAINSVSLFRVKNKFQTIMEMKTRQTYNCSKWLEKYFMELKFMAHKLFFWKKIEILTFKLYFIFMASCRVFMGFSMEFHKQLS